MSAASGPVAVAKARFKCSDNGITVPVKVAGTKSLTPEKGGCAVEWKFDVTCGIPLLGGVIASFVGSEMEQKLEREFKVLKSMA